MSQHQNAATILDQYLKSLSVPFDWQRVECCAVSRFLYCSECCRLLVPENDWPQSVKDGTFRLPFQSLHVILRDRKTAATGLHAMALLQATTQRFRKEDDVHRLNDNKVDDQERRTTVDQDIIANTSNDSTSVSLYDIDVDEDLPDYESIIKERNGSVYLLYPDKTSVPLSSVTGDISTLVVMDVTWQRRNPKTLPSLDCLPRVHLTSPPEESRFWRWHNAGPGMVSTIEALYFASWEIALQKGWSSQQLDVLVEVMWLFGLQRYQIHAKYRSDKALPFTPDGKEARRAMYRTVGTEKHERDKAKGRLLKRQQREEKKKKALTNGEPAVISHT